MIKLTLSTQTKFKMKKITTLLIASILSCSAYSQDVGYNDNAEKNKLHKELEYKMELQSSFSNDKTPLWLNANRHGLSSLDKSNGYLRAGIIKSVNYDENHKPAVGYGVDVAVPYNFTSNFVVQQAFVDVRWMHGLLTVGSKEYPLELKNNALSSGSQTLGINARPVPQVRIALPDYWTLPFGNGWLHLKGHIAYGAMTDDKWQHSFTGRRSKYADNVLFHSKSGYIKIGNEKMFYDWSFEFGLEMASNFGGTSYKPQADGTVQVIKNGKGIKDFWRAFVPGGAETSEKGTVYQNAAGNQLGSWVSRISYNSDTWAIAFYADKFFEDHSSMLQLDYNGYGTGDEWNKKKKSKYFAYALKDWLLGIEYNNKYESVINTILFEYIYSKYQAGPVYHDHSQAISEHISGMDEFYNHSIYTGWQHWGQVMGNPLYRSPIYNDDGRIEVKDNRFVAFHLGIDGTPFANTYYRFLATYQKGFGTYHSPYNKKLHNVSFLLECEYGFTKSLSGWKIKGGYAMDFGRILGNNHGFTLTVSKSGLIKF